MAYRKYSDEFKREVLGMVTEGNRVVAQPSLDSLIKEHSLDD